ncbi:hypothetical protein MKD41_12815 [Lutibacter sp. A64]|uniref:hypothetical protein n=1 Tax=Lutibacter sp. A64 TaxID=2918526 RepID=UPI001F0687C4|nr:hypothetical protein [Lutibacter sp. A64]UMB53210.1 hypothetical protein MKD41_12815 [Lutibacter sp. A64]
MHKKLEAELERLAHSILELKNNDVTILHKKAHAIYEKLTILKFVEENLNSSNNFEEVDTQSENVVKETVEDVKEMPKIEESVAPTLAKEPEITNTVASIVEVAKELEETPALIEKEQLEFSIEDTPPVKEEVNTASKEVIEEVVEKVAVPKITLEEEFKDAISADVATNLFEKATKENPVVKETPTPVVSEKKRSINDTLFKSNLQIGLNDRIAFVKHLFEGSQEDFNRVLSQLNSFKTEQEAKDFLNNFVKPDYNWDDKQEYEQRLIDLIERKFL